MADKDNLATRAPESDAQESLQPVDDSDSIIPGDSKPDQGQTSMGKHCVTDRPTPAGQAPTGDITKYNDVEVYVTKPADYPHAPCKLLLLLTGGTGIHSTNSQLQADKFAAEGFLVVMPDQFAGDPAPSTTTTFSSPTESHPSVIEQVKLGVAEVAKSFTIDMWLARHTPETVLPNLHAVLASVREEYADAVAHGDGVYAAGYCVGARYALLLAGETGGAPSEPATPKDAEQGAATAPSGSRVKAVAIAHGAQIAVDELAAVRAPTCIVAVEEDSLFPDEVRETGVRALREQGVEVEVEVYPGMPHGFAVVGEYEDGEVAKQQAVAFRRMLGWLKER